MGDLKVVVKTDLELVKQVKVLFKKVDTTCVVDFKNVKKNGELVKEQVFENVLNEQDLEILVFWKVGDKYYVSEDEYNWFGNFIELVIRLAYLFQLDGMSQMFRESEDVTDLSLMLLENMFKIKVNANSINLGCSSENVKEILEKGKEICSHMSSSPQNLMKKINAPDANKIEINIKEDSKLQIKIGDATVIDMNGKEIDSEKFKSLKESKNSGDGK